MKQFFLIAIAVHALLHFLGVAKGFGWAELPQLRLPISSLAATGWGLAGVGLLAFALLFALDWSKAWFVGALAIVLSQSLIVLAWSDAKAGTLGNLIVLLLVGWSFASVGPFSFAARYAKESEKRSPNGRVRIVEDSDLDRLPPPVARYLRKAGVVGTPEPQAFEVKMKGRIRGGAEEDWMPFESTQFNVVQPPTRLFFLTAIKKGLPVHVLHTFADQQASMVVRLLAAIPIARENGPEPTRAETVTLLNDLCLFAPAGLLSERVSWSWTSGADRQAFAHYTVGNNVITARLIFNENDELIDFESEDRSMRVGSGEFVRLKWSTPVEHYQNFGPLHLASRGAALWHEGSGAYPYIEIEVLGVEINPHRARQLTPAILDAQIGKSWRPKNMQAAAIAAK